MLSILVPLLLVRREVTLVCCHSSAVLRAASSVLCLPEVIRHWVLLARLLVHRHAVPAVSSALVLSSLLVAVSVSCALEHHAFL